MLDSGLRGMVKDIHHGAWLLIVGGVVWLIVAVVALRLNLGSVLAVGILLGLVFILTAAEEFALAAYRGGGWAVLRILLGIFFLVGAIWAFVHPYDAFWSLAAVIGILLIIKGFFDVTYAAAAQPINPLWWLGLFTGLLEIALGFWASTQWISTRALLLLYWVGFYAIFRGVQDLVLGFEVEHATK